MEERAMLTAKNVTFEYGTTPVLQGTTLSVSTGDKIGLVGPNGVGKSTLLKIMAGIISPVSGDVSRSAELNIGYMPQEIDPSTATSTRAFIEEITGVTAVLAELEGATNQYATGVTGPIQTRYEQAFARVEALGAYTLENRMAKALARVELSQSVLDKHVNELSGGQKTKLLLAAILLAQFDVYLLDEPTNNLDLEGIKTLENFITGSKASFVVVSHDRRFLRNCTTKIAELLTGGSVKTYSLGYDEYITARHKERESARQQFDQHQQERKRLATAVREKTHNARAAAGNRSSSDSDKMGNDARKERAAGSHAKAAKALETRLNQLGTAEKPATDLDLNFAFGDSTTRLPETIVRLRGATISYDTKHLGPYNLEISRGEKLVLVGPNGTGKTTLLKLLSGQLALDAGTREVAPGVVVGYIGQDNQFDNADKSVVQNLAKTTGLPTGELYNVLARFGLKKVDVDSVPNKLSPGQRSRALLAGLVAVGTNLLLLDEPTNHLDITASDELQTALNNYQGVVVVVTHDRELIDALEHKTVLVIEDGSIADTHKTGQYINKFAE